ncbi:MFS transporter [Oceanobacillus halotolerans]|uniref:MFS transporter n=1 Tax=Oceanobacillus halotolerans TaxID=2663380 RepID=UPI0013DC7C2D|nr:MFS transporter [Oceanobacillus halotolerans]
MKETDNKILSIWKNKAFLKLFSSYSISVMGQFFDMIAIILLFTYTWESEPLLISLIPIMYALPSALFSQFIGIIVDQGKKINLMLIADILTAILTLLLIFIENPYIVLGILLLRGTVVTIHFPAQQAVIQQIVEKDLILKAVTLNGTVNQLSKIIGPFLGATLAAAISPKASLAVYVIALLLSVCFLLYSLRHIDENETVEIAATYKEKTTFFAIWKDGWKLLWNAKVLFVSFLFTLTGFTAIQLVDVQFAVLFRNFAADEPSLLGWSMSTVGLGAVIVMIALNSVKTINSYGWILGGSILLIGLGFSLLGFMQPGMHYVWPIMACFVVGMGTGLFSVGFSYLLQKESPEGKIGQLSGLYNSVTGFILLIAPITGGIIVQWLGVTLTFQLIGICISVIGMSGIVFQRILWKTYNNTHNYM